MFFREITNIEDPFFPAWLDALEMGFPAFERNLPSVFFDLLKGREANNPQSLRRHIVAALDKEEGALEGFIVYQLNPPVLYLWYLLVKPHFRCIGIGSQMFNEIVDRAVDCEAVLWEVERPDVAVDLAGQLEAERRVGFYRKLGGKVVENVIYRQPSLRPDQPSRLMYIMFLPLMQISDQRVMELIEMTFDGITIPDEPLRLT